MPQWNITSRVMHLKGKLLPEMGVVWKGSDAGFVDFMRIAIEHMPGKVKESMTRYYVEGDTQKQNEAGTPLKEDRSFYNLLIVGRACLATAISMEQKLNLQTKQPEAMNVF